MRVLLFTSLLLLSLSSCDAVMFVVMGVKPLKPETSKSLLKYERKVGYNTQQNNFLIDSSKIDEIWKGAFPKAFIYDKNGNTVMFLDCFGESVAQLEYFFGLPVESRKKVSDTLHLLLGKDTLLHIAPTFKEVITSSTVLSGDPTFIHPGAEYYVVYFWTKSFGRINRKYGAKMEQYIHRHPEFNAAFIKINCDYQKDWGYSKKGLKTKWK